MTAVQTPRFIRPLLRSTARILRYSGSSIELAEAIDEATAAGTSVYGALINHPGVRAVYGNLTMSLCQNDAGDRRREETKSDIEEACRALADAAAKNI